MNLQLRRRQKIALVAIFALGFFVTIIQIIRIFTVKNLKTYTDSQPIVLWSTVEVSLGVCFCFLCLCIGYRVVGVLMDEGYFNLYTNLRALLPCLRFDYILFVSVSEYAFQVEYLPPCNPRWDDACIFEYE